MSLVVDGVIALGQPGESVGDDSPGGPEVSESEREKGLMPGDSQLGEFQTCSLSKATPGPDQSRKSSVVRKWEGIDLIPDEEIATSKKRTLRSDVAKQREMADAAKKNETEDGQEEIQVQKKRVLGSGVAMKREEGSTPAKKVAAEAMLGADQNGSSSAMSDSDASKLVTCQKEITDYEKRVLGLDVAEQREGSDISETDAEEEAGTSKKKVRGDAATKEIASGSVNGNGCAIIERKDPEQSEQETRVGMKRITRSDVARQWVVGKAKKVRVEKKRSRRSHAAKGRKEAKTNKNESDGDKNIATEEATPGAGQNGKCSAISNRNSVDLTKCDEVVKVEKRITRSDVAKQREEAETIQKEVMESEIGRKRSNVAFDVETTSKRLKVESSINEDGQKDDLSEKKMKPDLKKIRRLEYERNRWIKCSSRRTLGGFKGNGTVGVKSTRLLGRGGVLKALSCNKKAVGFEKDHIRRKLEENSKRLRPFSSGNKSASQHPSLYGEGKNLKVLSSFVSWGKRQTSSTEKKKSHDSKKGYKPNDLGSSNDKSEAMIKGESCSNSKARAKQKLRDQIKDVLLNAGWKIDLRPRKGRNYLDSVYISPQGSSYWSITKAYDVFQSLMNRTHVDKRKSSPRKSSKTSKGNDHNHEGTGSPFPAIPREALSILKKVFVNKRRSREEIEEANKKREDGSKNKKAKGITCLKHPKNKHFEANGKDLKGRIQEKNIAVSSAKGVGYTRKKAHPRKCGEKQRGMALLVRGSNQETETGTDVLYPWRRTIFSWMIDLGIMPASGRVKYMNYDRTQTMLEGWITRNGIHCSCCSTILTVSKFEIHAGGKLCQPYRNIYLEDIGISLMQCQLNTWEKQGESVRQSFYPVDIDGDDPNDDTCGICGDGGDLICCDGCPSTFHLSCLGIQMLPPGVWHCMNCSCRFCGLVSSAGPEETDLTVSPLLSCSQCEEKYHLKCVPEGDAMPVCSNLSCLPFCGKSCKRLFEQLRGLLGLKNDLEAGFSWTVLQRFDEDLPESVCGLDQRVECNSKIAVALGVMDECFLPIVDQRSGIDLIHNVVYNCGSNFNRLNYRGFYTFILEREDEVISTASLRIHGTRLAEMPFIGTRNIYRRQGMCRRLLNGIESALCSLNVEKLIIPAISELRDTWTNVFGFKPLKVSQKQEVKSINLLVFPGTGLLLKPLLKKSNEHCKTADEAGKIEPCSKYHCTHEVANESTAHSFIGLEADATAEAIVQCVHKAKDKEPGLGVTPDSVKGSDGSASQVLENKPLLSHPEMAYHGEPCSKYHRTHELAIESTVHSFIALEADASAEAIVQCVHEAKHKEPGSGVTPESSDGSDGSESQVSENKPSDIAVNKDLLLHPEMVYHDEPCCKYYRTHEVANESTVHSFIGLEAEASAEAIVHCVHKAKGMEPGSGVTPEGPESSDGSDGSESQVSENKSSDIAPNEGLLLHPEMVYHDKPVVNNKFQSDSCLVSEIKLPSEGNVDNNDDATIRGTSVVKNLLVIDDALVQPTSDSICLSPFASASILRDSGGKTGPILPAVDCTSLPDHYEVQCTSPDAIPYFPQGSGGNDIQISVSSLGLSSDDAHHCRSEVVVTSSGPFPIGNDLQKYSEHIVADKHNRKDEVATPQPDFRDDLGYFNAEIVAGPLGAVADKFLLPSVEPNIHAVGDYTIQTVHELNGQHAAVRPKTFADGGNDEQCVFEIIKTAPDVAPGIENQDFCVSSASHDTDIVSVLAASEHSDEGPIQHNSELQQKSTESLCDPVLPLSTKLHHGEHDLVNSLNVTSVPEQFGAYNSEEINDDAGYVGLPLSAYQTTGIVRSLDVASKSNSSDMVYVPTPDEGNHHMVAKDCPLLAPSVTYSWTSTKGVVLDNHNVRFQDDPAAVSPRAIIEVSNDHAAAGLESVGLDYSNLNSGATFNKISDSTGVVQHNLAVMNEDAVSLAMHVTRVESAVKPDIHVFGACSVYDASEVAPQFLDNGLQSVLESADVGNVQHNKLSFSSHTSTTGVSPLSTGRVGSCEIHEAVIVSNQGNSLVPRHDSAD